MTDEPTPLPTMGDALKEIFARYQAAGLDGYGDNGVIGWFLAVEADNKDLRARVAELTEDKSEASPCNECTLTVRVAELEARVDLEFGLLQDAKKERDRFREVLERIARPLGSNCGYDFPCQCLSPGAVLAECEARIDLAEQALNP